MQNQTQIMPCPVEGCNGEIALEIKALITGQKFSCPVCNASIGLSTESEEIVKNTMDEFEKLKKKPL